MEFARCSNLREKKSVGLTQDEDRRRRHEKYKALWGGKTIKLRKGCKADRGYEAVLRNGEVLIRVEKIGDVNVHT